MSAPDPRIHDYLDGRMSDEERRRFEARLTAEPELARRLADYRRLGELMRESAPDDAPSPGFATRVRAAAEGGHSPARPWRWLSWEAAGAAVAVVLLLAFFGPDLLRDGGPPEVDEAATRMPSASSPAGDQVRRQAATEPRRVPAETERREKVEAAETPQAAGEPTTGTSPTDEAGATDARDRATIPATPKPGGPAAELLRQSAPAPPAAPARGAAGPSDEVAEPGGRADAGSTESKSLAGAVSAFRAMPTGFAVTGVEPPLAAGETRVVDDATSIAALVSASAGSDSWPGGPPERLVLVAAASGSLRCGSARLRREGSGWLVTLSRAAAGGGAVCAVPLFDEKTPVRVEIEAAGR